METLGEKCLKVRNDRMLSSKNSSHDFLLFFVACSIASFVGVFRTMSFSTSWMQANKKNV